MFKFEIQIIQGKRSITSCVEVQSKYHLFRSIEDLVTMHNFSLNVTKLTIRIKEVKNA